MGGWVESGKPHGKPHRVANLCMARRLDKRSTIIPLLWSMARSCGLFLCSGAQKRLDNLTSYNEPLKKTDLASNAKRKRESGKINVSCPPNHMHKDMRKDMREDTTPGQQRNDW